MMRPGPLLLVLLGGICLAVSTAGASGNDSDNEQWCPTSESGAIKLYSRVSPGSALKEFKAMGTIDAPTRVVNNVINDVEGYPRFMPFTAECRILQRQGNSTYTYQRISPKIVGDRDYTLQVEETSWPAKAGFIYLKRWKPANEAGPPEKKGVLRVKLCEGGWLLEPESAEKTLATYSIYTDTGGSLPAFIANAASGIGIRKIFAAVRHQSKDPKYRADKDVVEAAR
jgi:polyketide cyclase/dehydrase/lipid transport protein